MEWKMLLVNAAVRTVKKVHQDDVGNLKKRIKKLFHGNLIMCFSSEVLNRVDLK
jgi:hypothetical protein